MYTGDASIGSISLQEISEDNLLKNMTYVSHQNYLFKGTVRENLLMGNPNASEEELWSVLEQVNLAAFLESEQGLDTPLLEMGSNFSGGQRQRQALVRALLHDSPIYIFDEATSNIDVESENDIVKKILELAQIKTVIMISHRLANVVSADNIYVLEQEVDLTKLHLQYEEVQDVKWASMEEVLHMIETGEFIPFYPGFIQYLFESRGAYGFLVE